MVMTIANKRISMTQESSVFVPKNYIIQIRISEQGPPNTDKHFKGT